MVESLGASGMARPPEEEVSIGTHLVRIQLQRVDHPETFGWVHQMLIALKPQFGENGDEIAKVLTFEEPILPATLAKGLRELADAIEGKK